MATTVTAPVSNSIGLASKYLPILDEIYKRGSLTSILDTANERVRWIGAKTANIFTINPVGLSNYSRNAGFVPGDVDGSWVPYTIEIDRGRSYMVDVMDNDESVGMAFGSLVGETERIQVIPEVDAYRFAKYAGMAGNHTYGTLNSGSAVVAAIQEAEAVLDDAEVPYEGRVLFVSPTIYKYLKDGITRFTLNGEPNVNGAVEMYDDMRVIRVPSARFNSLVTLNAPTSSSDVGGYTAAGSTLDFMVVHPTAVLQVVKHQIPRIFSPQVNQEADAWKFDYRIYHDAWVLSNKTEGIYVHAPSAANPMGAQLSALTIGALTLSPTFDGDTYSYTCAATAGSTYAVTATGATGATITIHNDTTAVTNGGNTSFAAGSHTLTVEVENGVYSHTYTVAVTAS